jgi:hypothetical protein
MEVTYTYSYTENLSLLFYKLTFFLYLILCLLKVVSHGPNCVFHIVSIFASFNVSPIYEKWCCIPTFMSILTLLTCFFLYSSYFYFLSLTYIYFP